MREKISILENILCDGKKRTQIMCEKCGAHERLENTDLIMNYDYHEPYGCSGGDFILNQKSNLFVKKCTCLNRVLQNPCGINKTRISKNFDFLKNNVKYKKYGDKYVEKKRK